MFSSPDDRGADDFPEIPRAGALWPLLTVAFLLGMWGLYLMLPTRGAPPPLPISSTRPAASPSAAAPPESGVAQLAFVDSADSTFGATAVAFAERVATLTGGALAIEPLPGGQVDGKKQDELALMRLIQEGRIPLGFLSIAPVTNVDPRMAVLDLPFLFDDYAHADRILDGPLGRELLETLRPHGLVGLGYLETGFRILSSSMPLPTLESLKGRRVRVMQSATYIDFVRALDAEAVPSGVDRIYEMGRQGYIDAADRSYPTYWDFKLYEVQRYVTETNHAYSSKVILVNRKFWDGLPPAQQQALATAAHEAERSHRELQRKDVARVKDLARKEKIEIYTLSDEERARFRERVQPLYEAFTRQQGSDLVKRIQEDR